MTDDPFANFQRPDMWVTMAEGLPALREHFHEDRDLADVARQITGLGRHGLVLAMAVSLTTANDLAQMLGIRPATVHSIQNGFPGWSGKESPNVHYLLSFWGSEGRQAEVFRMLDRWDAEGLDYEPVVLQLLQRCRWNVSTIALLARASKQEYWDDFQRRVESTN